MLVGHHSAFAGNTPGTGFNTGNTLEIPFYVRWASPCICRQYAPFHYFKRILQVICSFPPRKRLRGVLNLSKAERAAGAVGSENGYIQQIRVKDFQQSHYQG